MYFLPHIGLILSLVVFRGLGLTKAAQKLKKKKLAEAEPKKDK